MDSKYLVVLRANTDQAADSNTEAIDRYAIEQPAGQKGSCEVLVKEGDVIFRPCGGQSFNIEEFNSYIIQDKKIKSVRFTSAKSQSSEDIN